MLLQARGLVKSYPGARQATRSRARSNATGAAEAPDPHRPSEKDGEARRAVDGVSFEVNAGEVFGLFGPNGAGKSTSLRLVSGMTRPDEGKIWVCGVDAVARPNDVRGQMSILLEAPLVYEGLTARDYLRTFARVSGLSSARSRQRVDEVCRLIDVAKLMDKRLVHMSLGERQRMEIARVLIPDRKLLVLDEPFNGVDVEMRRRIREHLRTLLKDGHGIIFTSHNLVESEGFVDRFAFIVSGRILAVGGAKDLREKFLLPVFRLDVTDRKKARRLIEDLPSVRDVQDDDSALRVVFDRRESAAGVVRVLVEGGVGVLELRGAGTMEDVFFKLADSRGASAERGPNPRNDPEGGRGA
ncbi:MAG: ABC transporter ATP-binding protein [Euryarchaeota archaeon]|nr:ABC transporter ATP-binding protein [Euryarchaeota archaeon]